MGIHIGDRIFGDAGSAIISAFSLVIACVVQTRERFMGISQVLTMLLFFASNAIYVLALMPPWLQVVAKVNPLTYLVDILCGLMMQGGQSIFGIGFDLGVMGCIFLLLVAIASKLYPTLIR